jgi:hypothetical protein
MPAEDDLDQVTLPSRPSYKDRRSANDQLTVNQDGKPSTTVLLAMR